MLENIFKKSEKVEVVQTRGTKPEDYYGRFTLTDVDHEIDEIQLKRKLGEVELDFANNKVRYEETGDPKFKKHMNYCRFFISRIEQRISEIKKIQGLSRDVIKYKRASPDKWKLMVSLIVERYSGVDINHINEIIDKAD